MGYANSPPVDTAWKIDRVFLHGDCDAVAINGQDDGGHLVFEDCHVEFAPGWDWERIQRVEAGLEIAD